MNNIEQIKSLLQKYWDCETTLQEEQSLREYFNQNDIDDSLQQYQALFQYFKSESKVSHKLDIERLENQLQERPVVHLKTKHYSIVRRFIAIAASLLLLAIVVFTFKNNVQPNSNFAAHAVEDTDEALELTMEALAFLSAKLDDGSSQIGQDLRHIAAIDIMK